MKNEEIQYEYFESISPYNILVVSSDGELINILCPFKAKAKVTFPDINANDFVWVQKVQTTGKNKDVFIIGENAYLIGYFQIILE